MGPSGFVEGHSRLRTLTLVSAGSDLPEAAELRRLEEADEIPRSSLFRESLHSDMLDERFLASAPYIRSRAYARIPVPLAQVIEAFALRNKYDAVISWAEHLGLPLAGLFKTTGSRPVHIALFSWISRPKKALLLKRVHSHIDRIILWSSAQRDYAIHQIGIPPSKIAFTKWYVDQKFWRPLDSQRHDLICSAGREMRDYGTLIESLRDTDIPCHIAAKAYPGKDDKWIDLLSRKDAIPQHVSVGPKNPVELRRLFARARFVVIPILPTDTDNGVTCILEAMAMGKAVICSRVEGQRDVIQEGKTGIYVTPQNPRALREAIAHLWANPEKAARMGEEGRVYVEKYHTFDAWVANVRDIVVDTVRARRGAPLGEKGEAKHDPDTLQEGGVCSVIQQEVFHGGASQKNAVTGGWRARSAARSSPGR